MLTLRFFYQSRKNGMLKVGVFGAGHLGKIHLKLLKEIPQYEVIGFYDPGRGECHPHGCRLRHSAI